MSKKEVHFRTRPWASAVTIPSRRRRTVVRRKPTPFFFANRDDLSAATISSSEVKETWKTDVQVQSECSDADAVREHTHGTDAISKVYALQSGNQKSEHNESPFMSMVCTKVEKSTEETVHNQLSGIAGELPQSSSEIQRRRITEAASKSLASYYVQHRCAALKESLLQNAKQPEVQSFTSRESTWSLQPDDSMSHRDRTPSQERAILVMPRSSKTDDASCISDGHHLRSSKESSFAEDYKEALLWLNLDEVNDCLWA